MTVRPTRFIGLGYTKTFDVWRFIDTETGAAIGPIYRTKAELMGDLTVFAGARGLALWAVR